jgi:hypothetical protein
MVDKNISLTDLERQLSRRLEEVQNLQRELEQKKAEFQDLKSLRELLEKQLQEVDAKIAGIGTSTKVGIETKPVATPVATRTVVAPSQPVTVPARPKPPQPTPVADPAPPKSKPSLVELLVTIVQEAGGRPITSQDMIDELKRRKFRSQTKDLGHVVHNRVTELISKGVLTRPIPGKGQGVVLAKPKVKKEKERSASATVGEEKPASLMATIVGVLKASTKPLPGKEIAERVLKAGFVSKSDKFLNVVGSILTKLKKKVVIVRVAEGYRLRKK